MVLCFSSPGELIHLVSQEHSQPPSLQQKTTRHTILSTRLAGQAETWTTMTQDRAYRFKEHVPMHQLTSSRPHPSPGTLTLVLLWRPLLRPANIMEGQYEKASPHARPPCSPPTLRLYCGQDLKYQGTKYPHIYNLEV